MNSPKSRAFACDLGLSIEKSQSRIGGHVPYLSFKYLNDRSLWRDRNAKFKDLCFTKSQMSIVRGFGKVLANLLTAKAQLNTCTFTFVCLSVSKLNFSLFVPFPCLLVLMTDSYTHEVTFDSSKIKISVFSIYFYLIRCMKRRMIYHSHNSLNMGLSNCF